MGSADPVQPEEWNTAIELAQSVDDGFMEGGNPRGQDIMQSDGGGGAPRGTFQAEPSKEGQ